MQSEQASDAARCEPESPPQLRNRQPTATPAVTGSADQQDSGSAAEGQYEPSQAARHDIPLLTRMLDEHIKREGSMSSFFLRAGLLRDILADLARFEHDTEKRVRESVAGEANVERVALAAFGASDAACYLYPGGDQQAERAAFCAGAAHAMSGNNK